MVKITKDKILEIIEEIVQEEWSESERKNRKSKCDNPKGFTMKQFCKNQNTRSKEGEKKNEEMEVQEGVLKNLGLAAAFVLGMGSTDASATTSAPMKLSKEMTTLLQNIGKEEFKAPAGMTPDTITFTKQLLDKLKDKKITMDDFTKTIKIVDKNRNTLEFPEELK